MAIVGNPILLSGGSSESLINLPITISLNEPIPERVGHLWVVSDKESSITKVEFNETLNSNATNGTLQLIVPLEVQHLDIAQYMKIGTRKVIGTLESGNAVSRWIIGDIEKNDEHCKLYLDSYPLVYTNISGVRYIENAFVWSGTEWFMCCQKDSYLYAPYGASAGLYNIIDYSSAVAKNTFSNTNSKTMSTISPRGKYIFDAINKKILKKDGDEYKNWVNSPITYASAYAIFSPDDSYVAISKSTTLVSLYKISSSGLTYIQDVLCGSYETIPIVHRVVFSQDNSIILTISKTVVSSTDRPNINVYKLNNSTGLYENTSSYAITSEPYSVNDVEFAMLNNNTFFVNCMLSHTIYKFTIDNNGIINTNFSTLFKGTKLGSANMMNYLYTTRDGKWLFLGSYSTNLGMDLSVSGYTNYDKRGHMIVVNAQTGNNQTQGIYDNTLSVRGVFDTADGEIKVLCYINNYGYVVVTWKDTGANTLTYVGQQKILDYANVGSSYSSACPIVAQ